MFAQPLYVDDTDVPGFIDLGGGAGTDIAVHTFRNRFDLVETTADHDSTAAMAPTDGPRNATRTRPSLIR